MSEEGHVCSQTSRRIALREQVRSMSMEDMLCLAQRAAAGDSTAAAAHFKRLLERYRHHPAVQKRGREVTSVARACGSVAARGGGAAGQARG